MEGGPQRLMIQDRDYLGIKYEVQITSAFDPNGITWKLNSNLEYL